MRLELFERYIKNGELTLGRGHRRAVTGFGSGTPKATWVDAAPRHA